MRRGAVLLLLFLFLTTDSLAVLPEADPASVGMDADRLRRIDGAIDRAIERGEVPGAVVLVGRRGSIVYSRASGRRSLVPMAEPMTRETAFDMASLTKPVATATSILILIEEGKLRLDDRLGRLLPEFDNHGKGLITVEQLLRHRAGLIPDDPMEDYREGPEAAWNRIAELDLVTTPGERFLYSDVGFLILGRIVEKLGGQSLDVFARDRIFAPLGMAESGFRPVDRRGDGQGAVPVHRIAPTEPEKPGGRMLRGTVHDPRSRALGGVAGHAGLFATADNLAVFAQMMLNGGIGPNGRRILSPMAVRTMIDAASTPPGQRRGLGWDVQTSQSATRGALFGPISFGHTGFTGTSLWIDPETQTLVILLTSRLHPDGKGASPSSLRSEVATLAAAAILDAPALPVSTVSVPSSAVDPDRRSSTRADVRCGIDVLVEQNFRPIRGKRVALVTNQTGRTRGGASTVDVMFRSPEIHLVKLFSPEHGIRGVMDSKVPDGVDESTGLPIVSLYGMSRKPIAKDLEGVDVLAIDVQDVGVRFYTYISTLGLVMEAASENGKEVVVLDRPNPIGGRIVSGPSRDPEFASFIAYHDLPVRHGMTLGELAQLYNAERKIGAKLRVIACKGWSRDDLFDQTGLLWTNPSPNMRSLTEAMVYPGIGLLEATNLATGRGTDTPFERVGAPWIDPRAFASAMNAEKIPGARFLPIEFVPKERQYAGARCGGVYIVIDDWSRFDPLRLGIAMASRLHALYPDSWKPEGLLKLLCHRATYEKILAGKPVSTIMVQWESDLARFRQIRQRYLIY